MWEEIRSLVWFEQGHKIFRLLGKGKQETKMGVIEGIR